MDPDLRLTDAHARSVDDVMAALGTGPGGLGADEAAERLARIGPNTLAERASTPTWRLLLDEVRNPLVLILLGAVAVLSIVSLLDPAEDHWRDAGLISAIVVLNGLLGFVQNYRAQRGIEALRRLAVPEARVVRDGQLRRIRADELVPGDLVLLEEGDRVPADGRIVRAHDLRVDESSLTGESMPVDKTTDALPADTPLAERANMAFMGTAVSSGRGRFVVTSTGMATEIGAIAEAVQGVEEGPTPFQREVGQLGRQITLIVGILIVGIAVLQLTVGGRDPLETFITAVALAVAAIPEGLPVVMTLALAFGTRRMLGRNALVRSLPVVEILGSADVVCTDKTGTITEGRMSVRRLWTDGRDIELTGGSGDDASGEFLADGRPVDMHDAPILRAAALCNDAHPTADGGIAGDPTEVALLVAARKAGVDVEDAERLEEIPFSSERKRMSVVVATDRGVEVFAKGAPEVILPRCSRILENGEIRPLEAADRERIVEATARMARDALRVLALAGKPGAPASRDDIERDLVFLGLAGIADPPRPEAASALRATTEAGIRVVMITGDNPVTAAAVARDVGLEADAIEGRELEQLDDDAIAERAGIFARVEPRHKLRVLRALRERNHVVVMTGDGVNDAPALKGAHVGIAMGVRGTDVARDASDMVLLDDNFATIVAAIEEGRRIAANIKKFLNYLLTGNFAEVLVILVASLLGHLPITAVQILWVNLVTDSGPALALAVDPAAPDQMRQPPRRGPIIGRAMLALVGGIGALIAAIVLATFFIGLALFDVETARTMTFTALVAQEYLRLAVIRVQEGLPLGSNRWLVLAVAISLGLQALLLFTPVGSVFGVVPLEPMAWAVIAAGLLIGFPAALVVTRLVRRTLGPL
ncbi:MAG TPA: cation-transporting P-type ATPase [Candidatus Limnocylindria bacterium]|nr:cation-transporting P-type ATPase [Candidatus Limnocylindria bacterium]